jgi:hypothetical protein
VSLLWLQALFDSILAGLLARVQDHNNRVQVRLRQKQFLDVMT